MDALKNPKNKSCALCKITYIRRDSYLEHMKTLHKDGKNASARLRGRQITPNHGVEPDPNDSDFYCLLCKRDYTNHNNFNHHLRLFHPNIKLDDKRLVKLKPIIVEMDGDNPHNKTCTICDREYTYRYSYLSHMNRYHKDGKREPFIGNGQKLKIDLNVKPQWDSPNNFCILCKGTYSQKHSCRWHIQKFPGVFLQVNQAIDK